jgi:hypothetical protein
MAASDAKRKSDCSAKKAVYTKYEWIVMLVEERVASD